MGIPYLKVQPETAISVIDDCIVKGYEIKTKISHDYHSDKEKVEGKISEWQKTVIEWLNSTIEKLSEVFVSQKELYNFRDVVPPLAATSENMQYFGIVHLMQARINKLNEYDNYIRDKFDVKVEVVMGDKITQHGDNSSTIIRK